MLKILLFNYKILNQFVTQTYLKFTLREKRTEKVEDNLYNSTLKKKEELKSLLMKVKEESEKLT